MQPTKRFNSRSCTAHSGRLFNAWCHAHTQVEHLCRASCAHPVFLRLLEFMLTRHVVNRKWTLCPSVNACALGASVHLYASLDIAPLWLVETALGLSSL